MKVAGPIEAEPNHYKKWQFGKRHVIVLWLFTGFICLYLLRVCINVAIVSMIKMTNSSGYAPPNPNRTDICPLPPKPNVTLLGNVSLVVPIKGEFEWDHIERGLVLSAFYYGFMSTQMFGGYLPQVIGGRNLFGISVCLTGLLTVINPIAARTNVKFHIAVRVLEGIAEGVHMPCSHFLLSNWAPSQERSVLVLFPATGANIATVMSAPLTALMCQYGFDGGWPTTFYVWGALACLWSIGWFLVVHDAPSQHPTISPEERKYIEDNTQAKYNHVPYHKAPWKDILLSGPVWGIVIAQFGYSWNYNSALTGISTYLQDVLHISSSLNGLLTMLPYVFLWVIQVLAAIISDAIRACGVKTQIVRKVSYGLGMIISSICLCVINKGGCDVMTVVVLLCVSIGSSGLAYAGVIVNHIDVAPQYANILMSIANTFACIPGIVSPTLTGAIVNRESTINTWQTVFYISAGVSLGCALLFSILGDGEVQPWARIKLDEEDADKEKQQNKMKEIAPSTSSSSASSFDFSPPSDDADDKKQSNH